MTEDEQMTVEFTDRYGNRMPSWLRACHSNCEAMGWVPIYHISGDSDMDKASHVSPGSETREPWLSLWMAAEAKEQCRDGWHFVRCPECQGTGRVSWITAILRIPQWFVRAAKQSWMFACNPDYYCGDQSFAKRLKTALYICFWLDIVRLRR